MTVTALPKETCYLTALSGQEDNLFLEPTSGRRTFVSQRAMFQEFFSWTFEIWGTNIPSGPTGNIIPVVYEMTSNAWNFRHVLEPFGDSIFWEQDPALQFIEHYPNWLNPNQLNTYFPFRVEGRRFIANVNQCGGENDKRWSANVSSFDLDMCLYKMDRIRFVLPQPVT